MTDPAASPPSAEPADAGVRGSAREWHKLQLAALGFVGLCGVLTGDSGTRLPWWLQSLAGLLALAALALAALGLLLVAVVAWPITSRPPTPDQAASRLRTGLVLTCVAVGLTSLSAAANWWPDDDAGSDAGSGAAVEVSTTSGSVCGPIVASQAGWVEVAHSGDVVRVPLGRVVSIRPASDC